MNMPATCAGLQRFALAALPPEPWRNGGGWTRTVAATSLGHAVRWRVSAADITQPGPFSVFVGMERTAVLMRGPDLTLRGPQHHWVFDAVGVQATFPGELPLHATLGPEGAARLWNVMVDRTALRADVRVHRGDHGVLEAAATGVLVVLSGRLVVGGDTAVAAAGEGWTLGPDEGMVLTEPLPPLSLHAVDGPACWVMTRFVPR